MDYLPIIVLVLLSLKILIVGSEFSFIKWFKRGKNYMKAYNEWMSKKP